MGEGFMCGSLVRRGSETPTLWNWSAAGLVVEKGPEMKPGGDTQIRDSVLWAGKVLSSGGGV